MQCNKRKVLVRSIYIILGDCKSTPNRIKQNVGTQIRKSEQYVFLISWLWVSFWDWNMSKIRLLSFMNITPSDLKQWSWVYGDYFNWVKPYVKLHFHLRMSCKMRQLKYAGFFASSPWKSVKVSWLTRMGRNFLDLNATLQRFDSHAVVHGEYISPQLYLGGIIITDNLMR